jgi:hypothetical protein
MEARVFQNWKSGSWGKNRVKAELISKQQSERVSVNSAKFGRKSQISRLWRRISWGFGSLLTRWRWRRQLLTGKVERSKVKLQTVCNKEADERHILVYIYILAVVVPTAPAGDRVPYFLDLVP